MLLGITEPDNRDNRNGATVLMDESLIFLHRNVYLVFSEKPS